ncbi:MAG: PqqD family protein [Phycisphaeraceae bacterium]
MGKRLKGKELARVQRDASRHLLDAVPTVNQAVRVKQQGKALVLRVPIRQPWWMGPPLGWFCQFRDEKRYVLDEQGQELWRMCNGKRRTEEIIERFATRHQLRFHEARVAVMEYLGTLLKRNLMVMVLPQGGRGEGQE